MAGHGAQKLFGIFGGKGLTATGTGFAALGYRPGKVFAAICGLSEFLGGLGLAAGLLTPLAAAALIGVMINAMATVTGAHGLWETNGGVEYSVCIAVVAFAIAVIGPGRLALDRFFPGARAAGRMAPWPWASAESPPPLSLVSETSGDRRHLQTDRRKLQSRSQVTAFESVARCAEPPPGE